MQRAHSGKSYTVRQLNRLLEARLAPDTDQDEAGSQGRGFSGLASLVSDVSSVLDKTSSNTAGAQAVPPLAVASRGREASTGAQPADTVAASAYDKQGDQTSAESSSPRSAATGTAAQSDSQGPPGNSFPVLLWVGAFVVGAILLTKIVNGLRISNDQTQSVAPASASTSPGQKEAPLAYAVAALNANMRAQPSTRSKVIGTLRRGARVDEIDRRDGFIKFRRADGVEGWISSDILIDMAALNRLQASSPADYIAARERYTPIERLTEHVRKLSPQVGLLLSQIEGRQDGLVATIADIEGGERPAIEVDSAGGLWFSLAARAAADGGDHVEATRLATAAIYADPLKADYHTALGFSAIALGQNELLGVTAALLPALAPGATNTWIIVGINAAITGKADMANGALLTAIDRSRNKATTARVLRNIAARSENPAVVAAVTGVLLSIKESR